MLNRLHTIAFFAALASLFLLAHAEGSTITWTNNVGGYGSTITGVSDIPTSGTYFDGVYFGAAGDQTVGTDVFHPATYISAFATAQSPSGDIKLVYPSADASSGLGVSPSGYGTVLNLAHYAADGSNTGVAITFSNLLAHENYQAQIWVTYNDLTNYVMSLTAGNSILLKAELSATAGSPGQFALGTFVTTGVGLQTETLTLNYAGGGAGPFPFVNAIALRDLGYVPEPGSVVLMVLGALGLCIAARRRVLTK